ncbi:MAG: glycosyltransferase [Candidatus Altiarchaeales archaeon]|nr:glycosyltransferase [Candidatus Altiarchaeales archaeon]
MKKKRDERVAVVIPAYNEEDTVASVVSEVKEYGIVAVVDDGSTDDTVEHAKAAGAFVVKQPVNMGVGFTTKTGIEYAIKKFRPEVIVTIDADCQHQPELIPLLVEKIEEGFDVVFTNRMSLNKDMPYVKKLGNTLLSRLINLVAAASVSDTQSGFRAFRAEIYPKLRLYCDDYSFVGEFVYEVSHKKLRYTQVDIPAVYDSRSRVKGTNIVSGIKIFVRTLFFAFKR